MVCNSTSFFGVDKLSEIIFKCESCFNLFDDEISLNTHWLFTHGKLRPFCSTDKTVYKFNHTREYKREYNREYNTRTGVKQHQKEYHKKRNSLPEVKQKAKEYSKKYRSRPEVKQHHTEYMREYMKNYHRKITNK